MKLQQGAAINQLGLSFLGFCCLSLAACASNSGPVSGLPTGFPASVAASPAGTASYPVKAQLPAGEYRIRPLDKVTIRVFQVKDLSFDKITVDSSGQIVMPLIGPVMFAGRTPQEVSRDIELRLGERYLRSPQVAVVVDEAIVQRITVEGEVTQAGVFEIDGPTSLLQAVAMAKGPSKTADLRNVVVFRTIDGRRIAARFDLEAIRSGTAQDAELVPNDMVVVSTSGTKSALREVITALPALGIFAYF